MNLDIRLPIGMLFTLIGLILAVYGLMSGDEIYQRSLGYNVNLYWGLAVLAFGAVFLYLELGRKDRLERRLKAHGLL